MANPTITGSAAGLAAMTALGTSFGASAELAGYPVASGQALRYGVAALALAALMRPRAPRRARGSAARVGARPPRPTGGEAIRLALLAGVGLAGFNGFLIAALREADPASVGAVVGCVPVVLALAGAAERRRIDARVVAAAALVAAGAAIVQGLGGAMTPAGMACSLGALACEAAFSLIAAPMLARLGVAGVTLWASALAVPMLLAAAALTARPVAALPSWSELAALGYLGLVVTAAAFCLWYASIARLGVERAGLFTGVVPVSALLAGVALGQSEPTLGRLGGASAVGAGIALGLRSRPRHARARAAAAGGSPPRSAAAGRRAASGASP